MANDAADEAFRLGQQLASQGAWPDALAAYERAVALDAKHWKARFGCGLARQRLADYQPSLADFEAVLVVRPELPEAWYSRAISRKYLKDFEACLSDCDTALRLRADYDDAQYLRCACLKNLDRKDIALNELNALLVKDPEHTEARYDRGTLVYEKGDFAAAATDFDAYLLVWLQSYDTLLLRGLAAHYVKDDVAAIQFLTRAINVEPNKGSTYCRRALAYKALGQHAEAAADLARCTSLMSTASKSNSASTCSGKSAKTGHSFDAAE